MGRRDNPDVTCEFYCFESASGGSGIFYPHLVSGFKTFC